jgi:hypothetical protein
VASLDPHVFSWGLCRIPTVNACQPLQFVRTDRENVVPEYLHELSSFPKGKYDDQADSTSQALDWFKQQSMNSVYGLLEYYKQEAERIMAEESTAPKPFVVTRADVLREWDRTRLFGRFW